MHGPSGRAPMIEVRVAEAADYPLLKRLFETVYSEGHPLLTQRYWDWRFGQREYGRSIVSFVDGRAVGHVGAAFGGGYAWIVNVYLHPEHRGSGLLRRMYDGARDFSPLAASNVNQAGLDMYRRMGWTRYSDLMRFVAVNPDLSTRDLLEPVQPLSQWTPASGDHFWEQPGVSGIVAPCGTTAVDQLQQGGLRVVDLADPEGFLYSCWSNGVRWVDFVTSWADPLCRDIEHLGWQHEDSGPVPWRLNPLVVDSRAHLAVLAEVSLPSDFIMRRSYSDHARVGSLPAVG